MSKHKTASKLHHGVTELVIGASIMYTGPAGNGPYPGVLRGVGDWAGDDGGCTIEVTKPSGLVFKCGADLSEDGAPGTFVLVG